MKKNKRSVFIIILAVLLSAAFLAAYSPAYGSGGCHLSITQIDTNNFPNVESFVSFTDNAGETIKGLDETHFTVLEDGNKVYNFSVTSVRNKGRNVSTVLLIDCSYSMKDSGALEQAKIGASQFVKMMNPSDKCTVISFSDKITYRITDSTGNPLFTSDKARLLNAINSIKPEPFTRLYDGIYSAIKVADTSSSFRKNVLVLTDAVKEGEKSTKTLQDCISLAKSTDVPVYTIGEGKDVNAPPLIKIANETGGSYFFSPSPSNLLNLYQLISRNIHNEYIISYKSGITRKEAPKKHTLTVKVRYNNDEYLATKEFIPAILPPQHSNIGLIILIVLASLFIILLAYFMWKRDKKRCPQCGHLVNKDAVICPYCGYSFFPQPEEPVVPEPTVTDEEEEVTRVVRKKKNMAWLSVVDGTDKGKTFDLVNKEIYSIGRSADNDIVLGDASVSRKHAKISLKGEKYFLHDLGSSNGTFVNGKIIDVSEIKDGDVIYFGDVGVVFKKIKGGEKDEKRDSKQ